MADEINTNTQSTQTGDNSGAAQATGTALPVEQNSASSAPETYTVQMGAATPPVVAAPVELPPVHPADRERSEALGKINRGFKEKSVAERAKSMNMGYINIGPTPINPDLLKLIPEDTAKRAIVMPFFRSGKKVRVAVWNPTKPETKAVLDDLTAAGYELELHLASDDGIMESQRLYETLRMVKKNIVENFEAQQMKVYEKELKALSDLKQKLETVPSDEAVSLVEIGAMRTGASDIHYEPEEKGVRVRFRIDGILHHVFMIDSKVFVNMGNQIKFRSQMKLNLVEVPQDGRYSFMFNERKVDVRVSSLPSQFGESFVLRLLDTGTQFSSFEDLGFQDFYLEKVKKMMEISHGMILVTGPTGSGKTTTLYSMLTHFNKPETKVITLEDPIEYHIEGISQSQMNEKRGYDFANGLRAILRQDPDVVMIGEIRDLDTANTAAQAALTGHVLLSTLHTNSAIESIPRLVNMGLPEFMIAPSLNAIFAQRLVRRVCSDCREMRAITQVERDEFVKTLETVKRVWPVFEIAIPDELPVGKGCDTCNQTGYKGRMNIIELVMVDYEMKDLILNKASIVKLIEAARKRGMITMREDGMIKVLQGKTTIEEVYRATTVYV